METKTINFHIYRYHLLPIDLEAKQLEMFPKKVLTIEEIKENKNSLFKGTLDNLKELSTNYPLKLEHQEGEFFLFKLAQKKTTMITQNFENHVVDNEPYVYIVVNNNPKVQKIAISDNIDAFSKPDVVRNILRKTYRRDLEKVGLNIEIEQMFSSVNFWKFVKEHQQEITFINFTYIKPNLANISRSLPNVFRNFAENTNSHESHLTIKAAEKGILKNIDRDNKDIEGLVSYSSEGAGSIKMKVKKIRKHMSTKENPIILQIDELSMEGSSEQLIKLYQQIVKE